MENNLFLSAHKGVNYRSKYLMQVQQQTPESPTVTQFKKTLIIPQGAILLWSWRAHKKYIKLREQYNNNNKKSYFNRSIVINIEQLWLHHKIVMKLRSLSPGTRVNVRYINSTRGTFSFKMGRGGGGGGGRCLWLQGYNWQRLYIFVFTPMSGESSRSRLRSLLLSFER